MASGIPGPPMPPTMPDTAAGLADLLQNTTSGLVQVLQMSQRSDEVAAEAARRDRQEQRNVTAEQMALMQQQAQAAVIEAAEAYGHGALTRATTFRNALDTGNSAEAMAQYASFVETYLDTDPANPKFFMYKDVSFPKTLLKNANPMVEEARKIFSAVARAPGVIEINGQKVSMLQALDMGHKDPNVATQLLQSVPPGSESRKAMLSMFRNSLKLPKGQTSLGTVLINKDVSYVDAVAMAQFKDERDRRTANLPLMQREEARIAFDQAYQLEVQRGVERVQALKLLTDAGASEVDAEQWYDAGKFKTLMEASRLVMDKRTIQGPPTQTERSRIVELAREFEAADASTQAFALGLAQQQTASALQDVGVLPGGGVRDGVVSGGRSGTAPIATVKLSDREIGALVEAQQVRNRQAVAPEYQASRTKDVLTLTNSYRIAQVLAERRGQLLSDNANTVVNDEWVTASTMYELGGGPNPGTFEEFVSSREGLSEKQRSYLLTKKKIADLEDQVQRLADAKKETYFVYGRDPDGVRILLDGSIKKFEALMGAMSDPAKKADYAARRDYARRLFADVTAFQQTQTPDTPASTEPQTRLDVARDVLRSGLDTRVGRVVTTTVNPVSIATRAYAEGRDYLARPLQKSNEAAALLQGDDAAVARVMARLGISKSMAADVEGMIEGADVLEQQLAAEKAKLQAVGGEAVSPPKVNFGSPTTLTSSPQITATALRLAGIQMQEEGKMQRQQVDWENRFALAGQNNDASRERTLLRSATSAGFQVNYAQLTQPRTPLGVPVAPGVASAGAGNIPNGFQRSDGARYDADVGRWFVQTGAGWAEASDQSSTR